jgi:hypothetical protein
LDCRENSIAHILGNALKVTRDEHGPATAMIFQRECLHPQVVQLAIRNALRSVPGEPDRLFRRNNGSGESRFPRDRICPAGWFLRECSPAE